MTDYARPAVADRVFIGEDGRPIPYGTRWLGESPPDESYSVTSDLERFQPLHTVADALLEHLERTYDVTVEDDPALASRDEAEISWAARAVRVTPRAVDAAPLTIVWTVFPGVLLHAGALHRFNYPVCGCDACDDEWTALADDLERSVFDVVAGRYEESIAAGKDGIIVGYRIGSGSELGWSSGYSNDVGVHHRIGHDGQQLTAPFSRVWEAWPER
ncbi:hypothetical protein C5C95_04870 [Rathayibacter sp. AY1B7]|uniref:DUF6226 family protein n=1 Tax=unclassified Rathayibacter TaxID=2609250 RepID=UPI000CE7FB76|nr:MULTISPECIES: DUF6226 family protein [unclassified Rathayibacter]PPF43269.1 hypothetical protein C5E14_15000 [Rathayibacter sp. AY1A1]PPG41309.1 hypothetical protein C5C30_07910 [Rathayibacter sp. AY2B5]PPH02979.1 hypothetical protein C5C32_00095 [Rathayibacter sp. AY1G9]PPH41798.1 hypothetical protein C5D09_16380 [Rathayibacter sp. AY1C9]PPI00411.1 hypothetical protein C5C95_04870 [Rathayibacter sp. AY1B7]